jgi:hypothetical protein
MYKSQEYVSRRAPSDWEYKMMEQKGSRRVWEFSKVESWCEIRRWIPWFDESTGVVPTFLISPASSPSGAGFFNDISLQQCSFYQWIERVSVADEYLHPQPRVSYMWIDWVLPSGVVVVPLAGSGWYSPSRLKIAHFPSGSICEGSQSRVGIYIPSKSKTVVFPQSAVKDLYPQHVLERVGCKGGIPQHVLERVGCKGSVSPARVVYFLAAVLSPAGWKSEQWRVPQQRVSYSPENSLEGDIFMHSSCRISIAYCIEK